MPYPLLRPGSVCRSRPITSSARFLVHQQRVELGKLLPLLARPHSLLFQPSRRLGNVS
jgi:hypothetical protein